MPKGGKRGSFCAVAVDIAHRQRGSLCFEMSRGRGVTADVLFGGRGVEPACDLSAGCGDDCTERLRLFVPVLAGSGVLRVLFRLLSPHPRLSIHYIG